MKCYYAHPITDYGTETEANDIAILTRMGLEVLNPNAPEHDEGYKKSGMDYFKHLVWDCQMLAFRAFADGAIPAGVWKEIRWAAYDGKPIIQIPNLLQAHVLNVDDTRARLKALGRK